MSSVVSSVGGVIDGIAKAIGLCGLCDFEKWHPGSNDRPAHGVSRPESAAWVPRIPPWEQGRDSIGIHADDPSTAVEHGPNHSVARRVGARCSHHAGAKQLPSARRRDGRRAVLQLAWTSIQPLGAPANGKA